MAAAKASAAEDDRAVLLILGGSRERELAAARAAASLPVRAVLLSSGALTLDELTRAVRDGGSTASTFVDRSAIDTVSNFTSSIDAFLAARVTSVIIATDGSHRLRAFFVGLIVCGIYGRMRLQSLAVETRAASAESWLRVLRDAARAIVWVTTGLDGRSLAAIRHPRRAADVREWSERGGDDLARQLAAAFESCPDPAGGAGERGRGNEPTSAELRARGAARAHLDRVAPQIVQNT